jgi:hypothetical protein
MIDGRVLMSQMASGSVLDGLIEMWTILHLVRFIGIKVLNCTSFTVFFLRDRACAQLGILILKLMHWLKFLLCTEYRRKLRLKLISLIYLPWADLMIIDALT